jgi:hypothetical protein
MKDFTGFAVMVVIGGVLVCWGVAEYLTPDGYYGVRQVGGGFAGCNRLDEFPAACVTPDPT